MVFNAKIHSINNRLLFNIDVQQAHNMRAHN